jgi:type III secretion protein N (ATPase)
VRELLAKHDEIEVLIRIGEFRRGNDATADKAVDARPAIDAFLRQGLHEPARWGDTVEALNRLGA